MISLWESILALIHTIRAVHYFYVFLLSLLKRFLLFFWEILQLPLCLASPVPKFALILGLSVCHLLGGKVAS
jgi:hypothetical protein